MRKMHSVAHSLVLVLVVAALREDAGKLQRSLVGSTPVKSRKEDKSLLRSSPEMDLHHVGQALQATEVFTGSPKVVIVEEQHLKVLTSCK